MTLTSCLLKSHARHGSPHEPSIPPHHYFGKLIYTYIYRIYNRPGVREEATGVGQGRPFQIQAGDS